MLKKLTCSLLAVAFAVVPHAQSRFTLKVHTGRGQIGYDVNSTMVIGEKDILLIDPQFSLSEAHKLAAEILESKKHLATIYATHPHPDHLFGLAVLKQAFPDVKVVALPATVTRGDDRLAGAAEVLVPDVRHQHPRTGSGPARATGLAGADARGRAVSGYRWRAGCRRSRATASCTSHR